MIQNICLINVIRLLLSLLLLLLISSSIYSLFSGSINSIFLISYLKQKLSTFIYKLHLRKLIIIIKICLFYTIIRNVFHLIKLHKETNILYIKNEMSIEFKYISIDLLTYLFICLSSSKFFIHSLLIIVTNSIYIYKMLFFVCVVQVNY